MPSEDNPLEPAAQVASHIPFVAVTATFFFSGGVFLAFNYPLLLHLALGDVFPDFSRLFSEGLVKHWSTALAGADGGVVATLALSLSLVLGLVLVPLNRVVTALVCLIVGKLVAPTTRVLGWPQRKLFSAQRFARGDSPQLLSWLMLHPSFKAHWEWEYFLYLLHWDLFTNAFIFAVTCAVLLDGANTTASTLGLLVGVTLLLLYALVRSFAMAAVHEYYANKVRLDTTK